MKTQEIGIEIYDITKVAKGCVVEYSTDEAAVTLTIERNTLIEFIRDNGLDIGEVFNPSTQEYDQEKSDTETVLDENYYSIVSQYLNDLHK